MKALHGLEPHFAGGYGTQWESGERGEGRAEMRAAHVGCRCGDEEAVCFLEGSSAVGSSCKRLESACVRKRTIDARSPQIGRHQFIMITIVGVMIPWIDDPVHLCWIPAQLLGPWHPPPPLGAL